MLVFENGKYRSLTANDDQKTIKLQSLGELH